MALLSFPSSILNHVPSSMPSRSMTAYSLPPVLLMSVCVCMLCVHREINVGVLQVFIDFELLKLLRHTSVAIYSTVSTRIIGILEKDR